MERYILALDQGTTSSRAILFDHEGSPRAMHQVELPQIYPKPGWVEHDPEAIWSTQLQAARGALDRAGATARDVAALGITNQRETAVAWDRQTLRPLYNAIVWQCRRTSSLCATLRGAGHEDLIRQRTGLLLDPYFSATKMAWLFDHLPGLRLGAERGEVCLGTVDSWLLARLCGRHRTDPSNASRTMLYDIRKGAWDPDLCRLFGVPQSCLPEVLPTCAHFGDTRAEHLGGEIPVRALVGDQQAALFGQACFTRGEVKITYGTGCFALVNTGDQAETSTNRLLTTVAWDLGGGPVYALEGSVFTGGAVVQWLRDEMGILRTAAESERVAREVPDTGGVYVVPAFTGLGSPHWDPHVRGAVLGLTRGSSRAHLARAALESVAYQCRDLVVAMEQDLGERVRSLKADGGASANSLLLQFQADISDLEIRVPRVQETTALGAAYLAGIGGGFWSGTEEISSHWSEGSRYRPAMGVEDRRRAVEGWSAAVRAARVFVTS